MDYQHAQMSAQKDQEIAKYQGTTGLGAGTAIMAKPSSVGDMVQMIIGQSVELRDRAANIANQIAGSIPQPATTSSAPPPDCVVGILINISRILTEAIAEIARTQQSL